MVLVRVPTFFQKLSHGQKIRALTLHLSVTEIAPSHCSDAMPMAVIPGRGDIQCSVDRPNSVRNSISYYYSGDGVTYVI